ncbi:malonyl-ACP O-methyltransferase BioC [Pseudaeromonas pectinilytica]
MGMNDWSLPVDKLDLAARFGKAASHYDQHAVVQQQIGEYLLHLISQQNYEVALDLGCGTGFFLQKLQPLSEQVIALDLSLGMLMAATQKVSSASFICGDAEQLPLSDSAFDLVFSSLALQWCASLPLALGEIYRVLRPGGRVAFATLSAGSLPELCRAWQQVDDLDHVNRFIDEERLQSLCLQQGFRLEQWFCRRHVLHYSTLRELLMGLKGIGANQVTGQRAPGLSGRQRWLTLEKAYENERDNTGLLPVSYEVCYGVLTR